VTKNHNIFSSSIVIILNVIFYNRNIYKLFYFIKKFQIINFYNFFDEHYLKKGVNKWKYLNITSQGKGQFCFFNAAEPILTAQKIKAHKRKENYIQSIKTSYMTRAMPRVNLFCIKKYKKKLRFKSVRSFYKAIPKSLGFGCNVWPKNNIYNINNNIKLAWHKFKWVWLQYQTQ